MAGPPSIDNVKSSTPLPMIVMALSAFVALTVKLEAAPPDFAGLNLGPFRDYLQRLLGAVETVDLESAPPFLPLRFI